MAKKKDNLAQEQAAIQAEVAQNDKNFVPKQWDEKTNGERIQSFQSYISSLVNADNKKATVFENPQKKEAFWKQNMSAEEMQNTAPYNALTGKAYENTNALALRLVGDIQGYEQNAFLTKKQAEKLGGKLKVETLENGELAFPASAKIMTIQTQEAVPMKDQNGNIIPKTYVDENGQRQVAKDRNGNVVPKLEMKDLAQPMVTTTYLYHVSSFEGLDKSKLKNLDVAHYKESRQRAEKNGAFPEKSINTINQLRTFDNIKVALKEFVKNDLVGKSYEAPKLQKPAIDLNATKQISQGR